MAGLFVLLPVGGVLVAWLQWDAHSAAILREMSATVLPDYAAASLILCLAVAAGVALVGTATAAAVTLFDFPGRRSFEWALLLPLAMPAYVIAYAYTDFLQFGGPLQGWLRAALGVEGRVFPEVRNLPGAAFVFVLALYPYVYLLARAAFGERAAHLMEAARLLGAPLSRRIRSVALPLARPAVAAGVALALMETLADFGVSSYFGIQTFSAGIYKAWLAMDNRIAAAQLATVLLAVVALLLAMERRAQARMRFASTRGGRAGAQDAQPIRLHSWRAAAAITLCLLPVLLGFVLPVLFMLRPLAAESATQQWDRFGHWAFNSVRLGALSAALAVALAVLLAFCLRQRSDVFTRGVAQLASLGYAVPGAVIVVGLLLPVGWLQSVAPGNPTVYWVTGTVLGVVWAYLVRFISVALQAVQSGYARIPGNLDDSARMLGTAGFGLLARVHWPLLRRSAAAAGLLVFVDVMKELPATMVLRPFNTDTLAVVAYQFARDERLGEAALPSLALVLVGLIPVVMLSRAMRGARR
ncbi:MAG TPA: iron ABC transporter permease [Ramlibacter sp.]|nr:iron ABC transporter permease [Ramlibacter sp.]